MNVSMNQVLMRSLNTSLAAVLPVLSLLVVGSGILGAVTLREFALALLVGLITGSYSSIFIAAPLLAMLKEREPRYRATAWPARHRRRARAAGARRVARGSPSRGRSGPRRSGAGTDGSRRAVARRPHPEAVLTHPPRPRKKKRR